VRTLGAVISSLQVYVGKLIVDQLVYLIQDRSPQALGVIFQQFAQYEGRLLEQIGYGEIESMEDLEQIRHAAQLTGAESFIEELPKRDETPLGKWELEEGTVRRADQILLLRHGQIDEQGTHEELMQHNGRYAALFRMQARWYG